MRISLKRLAMGAAIPLLGAGTLFAMSAPSSAATAITVSPTTNITPGQKVTVSASGFSPKATLAIVECSPRALAPPAGRTNQDECDVAGVTIVAADASGNLAATSFTIPAKFAATDPLAVCPPTGTPTTYCGVAVANIGNTNQNASVPIIYAGQPSPTTTTTAPCSPNPCPTTTTTAPPPTTTSTTAATIATTTTTAATHVLATTATNTGGTLPVTGSSRRLLGFALLGLGFVVLGFALTTGSRRARRRGFRA